MIKTDGHVRTANAFKHDVALTELKSSFFKFLMLQTSLFHSLFIHLIHDFALLTESIIVASEQIDGSDLTQLANSGAIVGIELQQQLVHFASVQ